MVTTIVFFVFMSLNPFMNSGLQIENQEMETQQYVTVSSNQTKTVMALEDYLIGVIAAEMPASFELEALKAQAVASRTFVSSRDYKVDDTTASQVYQNDEKLKEKWQDQYDENKRKIRQALLETKGQVLTYQQEIISATFFSSSNGKTNNSQDYWTGAKDYLVSVDSHWDHIKSDNIRTKALSWEQLHAIFSTIVHEITIISHYDNGYVKEVKVNEVVMSGRELREKLALSSSCFSIESNDQGITFTTVGSGHGVGMSQYGAQGMAKEGYSYDEILKHYYTGVEIVNR